MKARKLKSGNWNVQVIDYKDADGKIHKRSFTASTKAEAEFMAARFKADRTEYGADGSVADMVERAIREKADVLSPSTLRGYEKILRTGIQTAPFGKLRVSQLSTQRVQQWISWLIARGLSPKSVKNAYGVFTSSYQFYGGDKTFRIKLPQNKVERKHVPSIADVKAVIEYFADDPDMTAAIRLCAFASLRRGEICALTAKDVDRKRMTVSVSKAMTETPSGEWVIKPPKTRSSVRIIPVSQFVLDALPDSGKCVNITPYQITNRFCKAMEKLDVEHFSFHDLRHFYASLAHNKGVSDITIQSNAGWSSAATMKGIYWGDIAEEKKRQSDKLNSFIDSDFR